MVRSRSSSTHVEHPRAWLITWEWSGDHVKIENENRIVAMLNPEKPVHTLEKITEQIYVSRYFAYHEQLAYLEDKKGSPYRGQRGTVEVAEELRKKLSLPSQVQVSDEVICGGNPWLWARIVHDIEAYVDAEGKEHLKWNERQHGIWDGEIRAEWIERHWTR